MSFFEISQWAYRWFLTKDDMMHSKVVNIRPTFSGQHINVFTQIQRPVYAVTGGKLTCTSNTIPYTFVLEHEGVYTMEYWTYTHIETSNGFVKDWKVGETRIVKPGQHIGYSGSGGRPKQQNQWFFTLQAMQFVKEHPVITKSYLNIVDYLKKMKAIYPEETHLHPVEIVAGGIAVVAVGILAGLAIRKK
jgi:hypothetical protein